MGARVAALAVVAAALAVVAAALAVVAVALAVVAAKMPVVEALALQRFLAYSWAVCREHRLARLGRKCSGSHRC